MGYVITLYITVNISFFYSFQTRLASYQGWNMVDWIGVLRDFDILKPFVSDFYSSSQATEVLNIINRTDFPKGVLI